MYSRIQPCHFILPALTERNGCVQKSDGVARTKDQNRIESETSKLDSSTESRERSLGEGQMSKRVAAFDEPHIEHVIAIEDEPAEEWCAFE